MQPSAKSLIDKLKKEQDKALERLKEKQDLAVELHAPSGSIIRIAWIGEYPDADDTLLVVGRDVPSGQECEAIVPVQSFYVILRVSEDGDPERRPVGFRVVGAEGAE